MSLNVLSCPGAQGPPLWVYDQGVLLGGSICSVRAILRVAMQPYHL